MKKSYEAIGDVGKALNLPLGYALGLPRVEIDGFSTVRVESHSGVREYSEELIELGGGSAEIRISGSQMKLMSLTPETAMISGKIKSVEFVFEEHEYEQNS